MLKEQLQIPWIVGMGGLCGEIARPASAAIQPPHRLSGALLLLQRNGFLMLRLRKAMIPRIKQKPRLQSLKKNFIILNLRSDKLQLEKPKGSGLTGGRRPYQIYSVETRGTRLETPSFPSVEE